MATGFESYGLGIWIFVIIVLIICCSAISMCCFKNDDERRASSRNQTSQIPYDPRTDGVVDSEPWLYSSHSYNSPYDNHHTTYDNADGSTDVGNAGGNNGHYDGDCGNTGGNNDNCCANDGGGDCGGDDGGCD